MKEKLLVLIFCVFTLLCDAQQPVHNGVTIGFYNIENLFDTEDDPNVIDEEFLPDGENQWTPERYQRKLANIAQVVGSMNPAILGLSEIENRKVLEDLTQKTALASRKYQIVHFDMRDARGVDVALIYQPSLFKPFLVKQIPIKDPQEPDFITRDILWVKGLFLGDTLHVAVNHWPSRRGGKEDKRLLAAKTLRHTVDSVLATNANANIVIMGDLNDDPNNRSVKKILTAKDANTNDEILINTSEPTFKKGYGTLAYNGAWNLFDQVIISKSLVDKSDIDYVPDSFTIAAYPYMRDTKGQFNGAPRRTFRGKVYDADGYSDHYPVYIKLYRTK